MRGRKCKKNSQSNEEGRGEGRKKNRLPARKKENDARRKKEDKEKKQRRRGKKGTKGEKSRKLKEGMRGIKWRWRQRKTGRKLEKERVSNCEPLYQRSSSRTSDEFIVSAAPP